MPIVASTSNIQTTHSGTYSIKLFTAIIIVSKWLCHCHLKGCYPIARPHTLRASSCPCLQILGSGRSGLPYWGNNCVANAFWCRPPDSWNSITLKPRIASICSYKSFGRFQWLDIFFQIKLMTLIEQSTNQPTLKYKPLSLSQWQSLWHSTNTNI